MDSGKAIITKSNITFDLIGFFNYIRGSIIQPQAIAKVVRYVIVYTTRYSTIKIGRIVRKVISIQLSFCNGGIFQFRIA